MKPPTEQLVLRALDLSKGLLADSAYREVFEFNDHREWGVAAELLSDILIEQGSVITREQFQAIEEAFEAMELAHSPRIAELKTKIQK